MMVSFPKTEAARDLVATGTLDNRHPKWFSLLAAVLLGLTTVVSGRSRMTGESSSS
ncbi:hypothetical protein K0M31_010132 [Melipona bicolor]|uniref:Uncharacterized protein n=1 Tax=Melipona bicolor TaxID=60889 RepID=A0AA40FMI3_9HYME|nr:hypothetical protein K0M31_010132 [Melipona bicolor]